MQGLAQSGRKGLILLIILGEILFFAVIITHVATSLTKALITLGWLTDNRIRNRLDRVIYGIGALVFVLAVFAIVRGQAIMFLS